MVERSRQHIERAKEEVPVTLFPLDELLDKVAEIDPEEAAELLDSWELASRRYIEEKADIQEEALRKDVNLTERFSLMFKLWAEENLGDNLTA